jgi:hypothetical protein
MTKRALLARLTREPITVEPICPLTMYRVALHSDRDPNGGVWLALASIESALLVQDYAAVHAYIEGKAVSLTYRETEILMERLRRLFARNGLPGSLRRKKAYNA